MPTPGRSRRAERAAMYESAKYVALLDLLHTNLRTMRLARGWTMEQAAEHCGMAFSIYQPLEAGKTNATLVTLSRVAEGFGIEPWELILRPGAIPLEPNEQGHSKVRDDTEMLPVSLDEPDRTAVPPVSKAESPSTLAPRRRRGPR